VRSSPPHGRRRLPLAALGGTLALTATLTAAPAAADHEPFPTRVTLMGSLQSELGCDADWDEACTATDLQGVPRTRSFELVRQVPAGSYEFKVRLNGSWQVSYFDLKKAPGGD
jgi:alpha-amylase